jgi:sulfhydrogenase subunit beta (sulfur reductase)
MALTSKSLSKNKLEKFLAEIAREYTVFVPAKKNGFVSYEEFKKNKFLQLSYVNFDVPPAKGFFFPPLMKKYIDYPFEDAWLRPGKKALYGVRPCDAQSLVLLDKAIKDNKHYKEKRDNILIIVQGCNSPAKTCFCTSVNGGPFSNSGADVFMADIGDRFVVEDISGRGAEYLQYLIDAGSKDLVRKEQTASKSIEAIEESLNLACIPETLEHLDKVFESSGIWRRLGDRCTNCACCTSVCPTCHCCFVVDDIIDMVCDQLGEEAKKFDPCMLNISVSGGLTSETPRGHQRLQRRLMDKFCHSMKTVGQPFCVGCGRCITSCMEDIDITEVLKYVINMGRARSVDTGVHTNLQITN